MVADDPGEKIKLKTLHCQILNDHEALKREQDPYHDLPIIKTITPEMILENYFKIKQQIEDLIETEIDILLNTP